MAKVKKPDPPDHLTMRLFAPGMTALHRAGLGGLACTLKYVEGAYKQGALFDKDVPGGPWEDDQPPWEMDEQSITLRFGKPENAGTYLERLFRLAFQIKDGLVYLPGQYAQEPPLSVRAELQNGLTLTFLQHGKTRSLAKETTLCQIDFNGDGGALVTIEYKRLDWYKHQDGWQQLIEAKTGQLQTNLVEVIGPLNPGAVVRHVAYTAASKIEDEPKRIVPIYFALVGCLALPVNRGVGVLITPEVESLTAFCSDRPAMTPSTSRECRVAGSGDAALQALTRLRARGFIEAKLLPGCYAALFRPTSWAKQQKSRVETFAEVCRDSLRVEPESLSPEDRRLNLFEVALADLPPRVWVPLKEGQTAHRRKAKKDESQSGPKLIESVIRPLIADNLALGKDWFDNFHHLMSDSHHRKGIRYEKEGLHAMTQHMQEDPNYAREAALVRAIHQAISFSRTRIKKETQGDTKGKRTTATINRQERFMERVRLDLIGAKTAADAQTAICKLFRNTQYDNGLQNEAWLNVLPLLTENAYWKKARNVALVALASWGGRPQASAKTLHETDEETE